MRFIPTHSFTVSSLAPLAWDIDCKKDITTLCESENAVEMYVSWLRPKQPGNEFPAIRCTQHRFLHISTRLMKMLWRGVRLDAIA